MALKRLEPVQIRVISFMGQLHGSASWRIAGLALKMEREARLSAVQGSADTKGKCYESSKSSAS
jgi:hypothetical protein